MTYRVAYYVSGGAVPVRVVRPFSKASTAEEHASAERLRARIRGWSHDIRVEPESEGGAA